MKRTPIEAIVPEGVSTEGRIHALDVIAFFTGFDALTGFLLSLDIRGRDGVALKEEWAAGPKSYFGLLVPGFPNLSTTTGPGSPSIVDQHAEWIADCIAHRRERGFDRIEAAAGAAVS